MRNALSTIVVIVCAQIVTTISGVIVTKVLHSIKKVVEYKYREKVYTYTRDGKDDVHARKAYYYQSTHES